MFSAFWGKCEKHTTRSANHHLEIGTHMKTVSASPPTGRQLFYFQGLRRALQLVFEQVCWEETVQF